MKEAEKLAVKAVEKADKALGNAKQGTNDAMKAATEAHKNFHAYLVSQAAAGIH
jgi:hypothetical protein